MKIKFNLELEKPNGCLDCPFVDKDTYQDMHFNISYVLCKLNQFSEDGRFVAEKMNYLDYHRNKYDESENNYIHPDCKVWSRSDE